MRVKYFIILFFVTIFVSCNSEEGNILEMQKNNIESYLKAQGVEYVVIDGIYKSMRTEPITPPVVEPEPEPEPKPEPEPEPTVKGIKAGEEVLLEVANGRFVYINYAAYIFTSSPSQIYATNIESIANSSNFIVTDGVYAPLEIEYGNTILISGLSTGLRGAKKGDSFSLFIPYDKGYGTKQNGVIPGESAINIEIDVIDVRATKL